MKKYILVLNAGSATLKFKLFESRAPFREILSGLCERIGLPGTFLVINGKRLNESQVRNHLDALKVILTKIAARKLPIALIGHRVVHGAEKFFAPVIVNKKIWQDINEYSGLAPLHNTQNLNVIKACWQLLPRVRNVAVFDTAFFTALKPEYYLYALPLELYKRFHVRRYGFHGISHENMVKQAATKLKKPASKLNLITLHLGNGCSAAAIKQGKPLLTSMGFTPLEGLVMGTRCGSIDPVLPFYLQNKLRFSADGVSKLLNTKSGLLGLSGFTSDMREILRAAGHKVVDYYGRKKFTAGQRARARLALSIFINRLREYLWNYTGLLGQVDAIVFSGGIGERSPVIRQLALQGLISAKNTRQLTFPANEEYAIVQQISRFI